MAVEKALISLIEGDAALSALIGTRVYPNAIPQNAVLPACAYQIITTERDYCHDGPSHLAGPRIQITISAAETSTATAYAAAAAVAVAMRRKLSGYRGTVGTVKIFGIFLENEYGGFNLDTRIETVRQDYRVYWKEE